LSEKQFGYVRLGTLTQQSLAQLDDTLKDFVARGASGLILDLRTIPPGSDFQLTADILDRFVPKGRVLFKLVQQKEGQERIYTSAADPIFSGAIAVLVSPENAGTAEAIAGTLRSEVHALIIGQKTSGRAVEYERYLIGEGLVLTVRHTDHLPKRTNAGYPGNIPEAATRCSPWARGRERHPRIHLRRGTAPYQRGRARRWQEPRPGRVRDRVYEQKQQAAHSERLGSPAGNRFSDNDQRFQGEVA